MARRKSADVAVDVRSHLGEVWSTMAATVQGRDVGWSAPWSGRLARLGRGDVVAAARWELPAEVRPLSGHRFYVDGEGLLSSSPARWADRPGWSPGHPEDRPTLGWQVAAWMVANLACPDAPEYRPFVPTREQLDFLLRYFELDPGTGRRRYRRAVYSRPKGSGKSVILAAVAIAEALAEVVPDGWDVDGQPLGRPWATVRTPWVQLAAVSEDQTRNAWAPLLEMLRDGPVLENYPGLEALETMVNLPGRGRIEFVTSAGVSREGNRPTFVLLDQTESWLSSNGGLRLAATLWRNLGKTGGHSIEAPNAYVPGERSVSEASAEYHQQIVEGAARDDGLLYDHRAAPAGVDLSDRDSLLDGLRYVYADSATDAGGWVDLERIVAEIWDPATDPQDARRYYLNEITHASDAWVSAPDWNACYAPDKHLDEGERVVLGFDGSRGRNKGKADATALVGCRVNDGHLFTVRVWEQPDGPAGESWLPPLLDVDAEIAAAFARWDVVGFYADPSGWTEQVARWDATYGRKLKVKASQSSPIAAWPRGKDSRIVEYVDRLRLAIVNGECSHDGSGPLGRHVLNARRRATRSGYLLFKEHPMSPRKIDAAYAAVIAWKARTDALSAGVTGQTKRRPARVVVLA